MASGKISSKFGTSWPATNPSSAASSCPPKTNVKLQKLVAPHVDSFDFMLKEGLDLAIADIPPIRIDVGHGNKMNIWIESAQIGYPTSDATNGHTRTLLPSECRQRGISYTAPLVITLGRSFVGGSATEHLQRIVGQIPVMVRSQRCHLANMSPPELVKAREEANEMGGYFICNGNERCVRLLQMPRRHHIMAVKRGAFTNRGSLYSELGVTMRSVRRDQSSITLTLHYLLDGNATVRLGVKKQEFMIPAGLLLKAMYPLTDREIYDRVVRGDFENTYLAARMELILRESKRFSVYSRDEALAYLGKHFRQVLPYLSDDMTNIEVGTRFIDEYVFVHIPKGEKGRAQKVELLCLMIRKLYAFAKGDVREDNPDSLMNHELLLPGHLYLMILKEKLQEMLGAIKLQIETSKSKPAIVDATYLKKIWDRTQNIGSALTYFLNTGNLRTSSGLDMMQLAGFTIVAEKLNYYRYFSHFRSVHRGQFFTTMKTTTVRKLLPDSWGFMCPVHTPDGSPCGLLNHLAVECELVTSPPFTAETAHEEEVKLARFLANLGMIPSTGYSDGAFVTPHHYLPVMLNGKLLGAAAPSVCLELEEALRYTKANPDSSIRNERGVVPTMEVCLIMPVVGGPFPGLYLSGDAARFTRPVKQINTNWIEYIGPMEQVFMNIGVLPADIRDSTTHMEIKPTNMLSLVASLTPFSEHNQSPRNMYQCQMAKQTMGTPAHSIPFRTDNKMYRIQTPQAPIVHNERLQEFQLDEYPLGTNAVVAVISYTGFDMEDAMILNKSSYERGFGHASVYKQIQVDIAPKETTSTKSYFTNVDEKTNELYASSLDRDGFPYIGQHVNYGEPIACHVNETTGKQTFVKHKETEPAVIDQINLVGNSNSTSGCTKASIKLRFVRNPIIGDKFSSRHGQKGVLSILWPQADMPFSESGMSPDIIINPHAFPSRMTIGMLVESMAAKAGALRGEYMDATPFQFNEENRAIDTFGKYLRDAGYNYMGSEPLYSGLTGTVMHADIYMGVVYYQRLRHMVSDKSQVRATGPMNSLTRQPLKGRKKKGGIRFGEMERDSLLAHGCSFLLQDRLMNCSDKHIATVCTSCGSLLSTWTQRASVGKAGQSDLSVALNKERNQWMCAVCRSADGCEAVAMPYVFRYLANELAAMNIKMTMTLKGCAMCDIVFERIQNLFIHDGAKLHGAYENCIGFQYWMNTGHALVELMANEDCQDINCVYAIAVAAKRYEISGLDCIVSMDSRHVRGVNVLCPDTNISSLSRPAHSTGYIMPIDFNQTMVQVTTVSAQIMGVDTAKKRRTRVVMIDQTGASNQLSMTGSTSSAKSSNPIKAWTTFALKRFHGRIPSPSHNEWTSTHNENQCISIGECDPRYILDNMQLQGGGYHTQLIYIVFNGRPLSQSCYDMIFTWFRAKCGEEFEIIPEANTDWYQPTAVDIGASLLVQVEIDDTVLGCLEHGPIVEDPSVRSRVENHLEDQTAFFTNVRIILMSSRNNNSENGLLESSSSRSSWQTCSMETWSLLVDDKRIRLSCESALIPPFEALYSSAVQMHLHASRSNALIIDFGTQDGPVHVQVDLHDRRDVIYLVFQAFSFAANASGVLADAISTGQSCMLTCHTLPPSPPPSSSTGYFLPWIAKKSTPVMEDVPISPQPDEEDLVNSMLLHDVDALLLLSRQLNLDVNT